MQTRTTTVVRTCDGPECKESLTLVDNQQMTEQLAIEIGMWLTVTSEVVTPNGMTLDAKTFCSAECLKKYIDALVKEYEAAEDRQLVKMAAPKTPTEADKIESFDKPFSPSSITLTDLE